MRRAHSRKGSRLNDPFGLPIITGATVALGDGAGMPVELLPALCAAARQAGGVRLVLGWCTASPDGLDLAAFADVVALMGGYFLREPIDSGQVRYLPARLGAWPALITDVLRPDLLIASVARAADGHRFTCESAWLWSCVDAGARVLAVERTGPRCVAGPPLPADRLTVVASSGRRPAPTRWTPAADSHRAVAERVAALIPAGSRVQFAPGAVGAAVLAALRRPVVIDTGVLTEAVVGLAEAGLLIGDPVGAYAVGSPELYEWADGRALIERAEHTHDPGRLRGTPPLFAVNTALEIDTDGQLNIETAGGSAIGSIGGQPDYLAAAAASPGGLAIVALPTAHNGKPTLVERLSAPASTAAHDVDVLVTDRGAADLRGLDRSQRRRAIAGLWT